MTDAASKAKEIAERTHLRTARTLLANNAGEAWKWTTPGQFEDTAQAIAAAIESAVQAERERAGKLVAMGRRMRATPHVDVYGEGVPNVCQRCEWNEVWDEEYKAYEVPHE